MKTDGSNPTLLYGYGGFEIEMLPGYSPATGISWLTKGGIYVLANIRGGGEFGPRWHQAALKEQPPAGLRRLHRRGGGPGPDARSPRPGTSASWAAPTAAC